MTQSAIYHFLKAVDIVLNSNTLLLRFTLATDALSLRETLLNLLEKRIFQEEFYKQDLEMGWSNYQQVMEEKDATHFIPCPGELYNPTSQLELERLSTSECKKLLTDMLTATGENLFFSPYHMGKGKHEAEILVFHFLDELSKGRNWNCYRVKPDFLYSTLEAACLEGILGYFEVECASDSATLFHFDDEVAILLTNGRP